MRPRGRPNRTRSSTSSEHDAVTQEALRANTFSMRVRFSETASRFCLRRCTEPTAVNECTVGTP